MSRTIALAHELDGSGLAHEAPVAVPAPWTADVNCYHHPHYRGSQPGEYPGQTIYSFSRFTGREELPRMPLAIYDDPAVTREQRQDIDHQYESARIVWSKARLRMLAGPLLREAAGQWRVYSERRDTLRNVYKTFWSTRDDHWRAQLLHLTDAQRAAQAAATEWDEVAKRLARLADDQIHAAGEFYELRLTTIAGELGITEADHWHIDHLSAYERVACQLCETPLVGALTEEIESQRARLREVANLAGDHTRQAAAAPGSPGR
jgi:hypothetical protein